MILLPNNCNRSEFSVFPSNWKTCSKKDLELKWLISYYFRDQRYKEKYPRGKFVRIKSGINRLQTLSERRMAIKIFLKDEKEKNRCLIRDVKRRDLKKILEYLQINKSLSNKRYNKIRAYTRMLFEELLEVEVIDSNPIDGLKKKKETKKIQSILTNAQRKKINKHLKPNNYFFWRFIQIFFTPEEEKPKLCPFKKRMSTYLNKNLKFLLKKENLMSIKYALSIKMYYHYGRKL